MPRHSAQLSSSCTFDTPGVENYLTPGVSFRRPRKTCLRETDVSVSVGMPNLNLCSRLRAILCAQKMRNFPSGRTVEDASAGQIIASRRGGHIRVRGKKKTPVTNKINVTKKKPDTNNKMHTNRLTRSTQMPKTRTELAILLAKSLIRSAP